MSTARGFLLHTNVVSAWTRPRPDPGIARWLDEVDEDRTYLSVATLAEVRHGVERLPAGHRRTRLDTWLTVELTARFEGRVLPTDEPVADRWGRVVAAAQAAGRPIATMDAFVAATALAGSLALVTRNVRDFAAVGVEVLNPWSG